MNCNFKKIGKGFLIGLSTLIPGFSAGTMALVLNCLEDITYNLSLLFKHPINTIKYLFGYLLGILIGIIASTFSITYCLQTWPIITASFFVGLVVASIPIDFKETNKNKPNIKSIICFLLCASLSLFLPLLSDKELFTIDNNNLFTIFYVLVISIIAASMMVIPAASGTLILLIFGIYDLILLTIKDVFKNIIDFNFKLILMDLKILIPFIIGVLFGVVLISKVLTKLFKNYKMLIWYSILGLLIASVYTIYKSVITSYVINDYSFYDMKFNVIGSVIAFFSSYIILTKLRTIETNK